MPVGMATAYDLTVGVRVNMDEAIYLLSPTDTPLLTGMGSDGLSVLGSESVDEIAFSWMTDTILTPRSTIGATATTGDAFIVVASGDRTKFSTGDSIRVIKAGATEVMRVTGYGSTTDSLTVTRGYDSTTATNYAIADQVIGLGTALAEGSDPENARTVDRVEASNYTQIYGPTLVSMSRTEQKVGKYGVSNELNQQLFKRTQENAIAREQSFLYGRKTNSTTTKIRTSGGLDYFITSNVDSTSTQLTALKIQTRLQSTYNAGGVPDRLLVNPASLLDLNDVANATIVNQMMDDPRRGRVPVSMVFTEFGPLTIVRDRWVHPFHAFGIRREGVKRRILDPLMAEKLAKTGDSDKLQIVCEEGLEVKGQEHMFKFTALSY